MTKLAKAVPRPKCSGVPDLKNAKKKLRLQLEKTLQSLAIAVWRAAARGRSPSPPSARRVNKTSAYLLRGVRGRKARIPPKTQWHKQTQTATLESSFQRSFAKWMIPSSSSSLLPAVDRRRPAHRSCVIFWVMALSLPLPQDGGGNRDIRTKKKRWI